MDNATYVMAARQTGLEKAMTVTAHNLANISTTGFRREGVIFAEHVNRLDALGGSVSQPSARGRVTEFAQGALASTGGAFDFAIEGDGFFQLEEAAGAALTRAGAFARNAEGELTSHDGRRVLGEGGASVFLPPGARRIDVSTDGTISADGQPVGRLALVTVADLTQLKRAEGGIFTTDAPLQPSDAALFQGFLERSNVEPVRELTRMVEIQRAYELGQSLLSKEDERMRLALRTLAA